MIDAIGDKILERAECEGGGAMLPSSPIAPGDAGDGRRSLDEVGPSGFFPKVMMRSQGRRETARST